MKYLFISFMLSTSWDLCAANAAVHSDCCRTLLMHANELIKLKRTNEGIVLYRHVRDHPNSEIWMIIRASNELKSYQLLQDASVGFSAVISRKDVTESQLLHVGKLLIDMGEIDLAKTAFSKVLMYHPVTASTREYIKELLVNYIAD